MKATLKEIYKKSPWAVWCFIICGLLLGMISLVQAVDNPTNAVYTTVSSPSNVVQGVVFKATATTYVLNVTVDSRTKNLSAEPLRAYIYNITSANPKIPLANATVNNGFAIFNFPILNGSTYMIGIGGSATFNNTDSGTPNPTYPQVAPDMNFIGRWLISGAGPSGNGTGVNDTNNWQNVVKIGTGVPSPYVQFITPTPSNNTYLQNDTQGYIDIKTESYNITNVTAYLYRDDTLINTSFNTNGNISTNFTKLSIGTYKFNATGINSTGGTKNTETRTITIYNALLNVVTSPISNFTIQLGSTNYSSVNHQVQAFLLNGSFYSIFLNPVNYAYVYSNVTITNFNQSLNISLNNPNSINISFFDELTSNPVYSNFSLSFLGENNSLSTYINGTSGIILNIPPDVYDVTVSAPIFTTRQFILTVTNKSFSRVNVFLTNSTSSIGAYILSLSDDPLPDSTVSIFRLINNSYVGITSGITDGTGLVRFNLVEGQSYQWVISSPGYQSKSFNIAPYLANSPYTFKLASSTSFNFQSALTGIDYSYSPINNQLNSSSQSFSLMTYSVNGSIISTSINCSNQFSQLTGSPSGGTVSVNLSGISSVACKYAFDVTSYGVVSWNVYYSFLNSSNTSIVDSARIIKSQTSDVWLTVLAYIISIVCAIVSLKAISDSRVASLVFLCFVVMFTYIEWIDPVAGGVTAFIGFLSMFAGSR